MKYSFAGFPVSAFSSSTIIPSCEVPSPSSSSAQIIPSETSPLILLFLIVKSSSPEYNFVPTVATTTFCPTATLGAPQTTGSKMPFPISTVVTLNLSAFGCCSQVFTSPTTMPCKPPFTDSHFSRPSTSNPQSVSNSESLSIGISISKYCFSQLYEIFIISLF